MTTKIPSLRFPQFVEESEWEEKNGNDIFKSISNRNHNSDLPILAITQEHGAIPRDQIDYHVIVSEQSVENYKVVEIGDFIISLRSFQGGIEYSNYKGICSPAYIILRPFIEVNSNFFKHYFKTSEYIKLLNKKLEGIRDGKMISYKYFSETPLFLPSLAEQTQIGNFLTAVDTRLSLLKQKYELLKSYKKGIMAQIFNQDLKFKDENGQEFPAWEETTLGEICKITTGKLNANAMVENGEYRFYTCAKDFYFIDKYAFDTEALLVSGNGANVGYVHYYKGKFNAYQRTYVLDNFAQNILYIKCFLNNFLHKRIAEEKNDGNTPYIVLDTLAGMLIYLPCLAEQTKIANFLTAIDNKINNIEQQIAQSEEWKRGLLQAMLV